MSTADDTNPVVPIDEVLGERDPTVALLMYWSARLGRVNDHLLTRLTAEYDLDPSESAVLSVLLLIGPPHRESPTSLRHRLVQTSGGMTSTLRRLVEKGLVEREPDPADGRGLLVVLTEKGRQLAVESADGLVRSYERMLDDLDDEQRRTITDAMRLFLDHLEAEAGLIDSSALRPARVAT